MDMEVNEMANEKMEKPDFSKIWGENGNITYKFSDDNYLKGWGFVGNIPPARGMFDAYFQGTDKKLKWLDDALGDYVNHDYTIDDTKNPTDNKDTLPNLLSGMANMIKTTNGTDDWKKPSATSLKDLSNQIASNNLYHAEATGYGIVSGCEPSINGLTVTVSAGVIHTADGRRVEVPEQSITLDAADATKPRTDVVYLDKYGKIAKLTGEIGTSTAPGLMEAVIKVGEIAIKAGAVAGAITASYNHYKTATITYHNVSMMRQDRTLMPGMVAHTLGYYAPNDGGDAAYIIRQKKESDTDDGGSFIFLDTNNVAELIIEGAVNVKQFGAKGDGVTDDTDSIQTALNTLHDVVIPKGTYVTGKSLYVTGRYRDIYAESAYIKYTGSEFALVIEGVVSSTYHLGVIWSDTGNAIKFTASYKKQEQGKHYCQYMTIYFKEIWAKTYDIKFDIDVNPDYPNDTTKNGWLNEIRFYNGRLASTSAPNEISYGVYADSKGHGSYMSYNKFYNVGLESPSCGIYMANKCNAWLFNNCHWWDIKNMMTTEGECNGIVIETSEYMGNLSGKFNLSAHTNGRITCIDTTYMATQHIINNGNIIFKDGINEINQSLVNKYNQDSYGSEKGFLAFFHHHVPNGHTTWHLTVPSFIGSGTGAYLYLDIYKNSTGNEYSGVIRGHCQNDNKELLTWFVSTGKIQSAD